MTKQYPTVSTEYQKTVKKARRKLRGLIAEKHYAPLMLHIAYDLFLSLFLFLTHSLGFNGEDLLLVLTVCDVIGGVHSIAVFSYIEIFVLFFDEQEERKFYFLFWALLCNFMSLLSTRF